MAIIQIGNYMGESVEDFIENNPNADIITFRVREHGVDYNLVDYKLYPQKDFKRFSVWRVTGGYKFLGHRYLKPDLARVKEVRVFTYRGRPLGEALEVCYKL